MKNLRSLAAVLVVITTIVIVRVVWFERTSNVFEWDALGYYLYLPAKYIYHDSTLLKWWPEISSKYHFPGGFYQALPLPNGNFVFFYSRGISMLQTPFFFIGHYAAAWLHFPQDGFQPLTTFLLPLAPSFTLSSAYCSCAGYCFTALVITSLPLP